MTLPAARALKVDSAPNGGVSVKAWSRRETLLRARVDTWGDTKSEAERRLKQVGTVNGGLHSDVPVTTQGQYSGKRVSATLGKGGAPVKVSTTNVGVRLSRAGV